MDLQARLARTVAKIYPIKLMRTLLKSFPSSSKGFSLVEMLVVIAVIGIVAAIAVPSIGSITGSAHAATDKRNAQNLASIYQSGVAGGIAWGATDVATATAAVQTGATNTDGVFFGVKGLNAAAVTAASAHLAWDAAAGLIYSP